MQRLTIIIVSRGLESLLRQAIISLRSALTSIRYRIATDIVVVDNASPQPYISEEYADDIHLIRLDTDHGFAAANNLAASKRPGDYYLLLNNDVLLAENALAEMFRLMDTIPGLGVCGSRQVFPDGRIQHAGVVFHQEEGPYHCHRGRPSKLVSRLDHEFQAVTGSCMLVRHPVWEELEGLCADYDFGLEDIDFCLRARQRGWRIFCCNGSESLHFESMTPGRIERDVLSRRRFMERWKGHYSNDG